ncbi:curculin domain-containing protein [Arthrobacter sp. AL08]|uniref:curculin domain-containing protein n=1 Tax=unclassified Arthrobacter TaxID=235627 RepID=UPI00249C6813|nr:MULTISPECIES: curculin domain-containing protein [unclassified Arthrobacter]MDI3243274.1 curculin domain-containing protein [Arthrobacter sp. AL05]MDI3279288.1 curculin domain-containing protein [Arthrobacter sp. AL08]
MTMQPETSLHPGDTLTSANGLYGLMYQADGNLVLYGPDGPLWASGTDGMPAGVCVMQADGNLVLYGPDEDYAWGSKTDNNPGSRLIIQNDGNVVIYRPDGTAAWATETSVPAGSAVQGDVMQSGAVLNPGDTVRSANGLYGLMYQADGNLVLYGPDGPLWDSQTDGRPAGVCIMQADGNLVLYGPDEEYVWDSQTDNNPGSWLIIQDDGNVVIYRPNDTATWVTGTH